MEIELTQKELAILEEYKNGNIDIPIEEEREVLNELSEKALTCARLQGKDPEDLLLWLYDEYKKQ